MTAPDAFAPYAARLRWTAAPRFADPRRLVADFLEAVARCCDEKGASVIGHLKCYAHLPEGDHFRCSLTSTRTGARCEGAAGRQTEALELDLAVLVYGLTLREVGACVTGVLENLRSREPFDFSLQTPSTSHDHGDDH